MPRLKVDNAWFRMKLRIMSTIPIRTGKAGAHAGSF